MLCLSQNCDNAITFDSSPPLLSFQPFPVTFCGFQPLLAITAFYSYLFKKAIQHFQTMTTDNDYGQPPNPPMEAIPLGMA